jgi:hypothetical protein
MLGQFGLFRNLVVSLLLRRSEKQLRFCLMAWNFSLSDSVTGVLGRKAQILGVPNGLGLATYLN